MPTPVGHALGGLTAALLANSAAKRPGLPPRVFLAAALLAIAPDLDIVAGSHRTYTHSVGAIVVVGALTWLLSHRKVPAPLATSAVLTAAYTSHLLLDWLGKDTSRPAGLMVLWPFSSDYFMSGCDLFAEVSR